MIGEDSQLKVIVLTDDSTVAVNGITDVVLQPRKGFIYKIIDIQYQCLSPGGTSSGTHELRIVAAPIPQISSTVGGLCLVSAVHNSYVRIAYHQFFGNDVELPTLAADQGRVIENLSCSHELPLVFRYKNLTDVAQTNPRNCYVFVKEIPSRKEETENDIQDNIEKR